MLPEWNTATFADSLAIYEEYIKLRKNGLPESPESEMTETEKYFVAQFGGLNEMWAWAKAQQEAERRPDKYDRKATRDSLIR